MNILLTGGLGYIGSHTAVTLTEAGHRVILLDNLSNSSLDVLDCLKMITHKPFSFIEGDVRDTLLLKKIFADYHIDSVVHFAGLKAVGESVEKPIEYFSNNVQGTISLLQAMDESGIYKLVFSSSATVYGEPEYLPLDETHPTCATNPYGRSKLHIEEMLKDVSSSNSEWRIVCLRYFNPVGAHSSGLIGEDPNGIPNNLMPYITRVASGVLPVLNVFGDDYPTEDGTAIRDYVHVCDLAEGHSAAIDYLENNRGWYAVNLGTGRGHSVFEMIQAFEKKIGRVLPHKVTARRVGDVAVCYAKTDKAFTDLGWKAQRDLDEMCSSAWYFQNIQSSKDKVA